MLMKLNRVRCTRRERAFLAFFNKRQCARVCILWLLFGTGNVIGWIMFNCLLIFFLSRIFSRRQIDFCANNPCPEGHQCSDHGNDFSCDCPEGRNGPDCSQVPRTVSWNWFNFVGLLVESKTKSAMRLNRRNSALFEHENNFIFHSSLPCEA